MCFVKTDMDKERLRQLTTIFDNEELAIYDIVIKFKDINLWLEYVGQVHNQTMVDRYEQHIGRNGKIRKILDMVGVDQVEKIELKCLHNYKHRNKEKLDKKEMACITERQVNNFLLKKKRVITINSQTKVPDLIKSLFDILKAQEN